MQTVEKVTREVSRDPAVADAIRINPDDKARLAVDDKVKDVITRGYKSHFIFFKRFNDEEFVRDFLLDYFYDEIVKRLNRDS